MEKEIKEELIKENIDEIFWKNAFYEQMVKSFAHFLYSNKTCNQIEKYSLEEAEDMILEAKKQRSMQEYYFLAGIAMYMHHGGELRSRKGRPNDSLSAALWFMDSIGMSRDSIVLGSMPHD